MPKHIVVHLQSPGSLSTAACGAPYTSPPQNYPGVCRTLCEGCLTASHPEAEWPPYPSVRMGAGVWRRVIAVLEASGTKRDAEIARRIRRDIQADAERIANAHR